MKTTVDLPESLLREAQRAAHEDKTTLKALLEAGLRARLAQRKEAEKFVLRDGSVAGKGRQKEFRNAGWEIIRDTIYESGRAA